MSDFFVQVFGKLITPDGVAGKMKFVEGAGLDSLDGDHDLKEHMVGILFSRSKLSHLQRQVCTKINAVQWQQAHIFIEKCMYNSLVICWLFLCQRIEIKTH